MGRAHGSDLGWGRGPNCVACKRSSYRRLDRMLRSPGYTRVSRTALTMCASTPTVDCDLAGRGAVRRGGRRGRPALIMRCCEAPEDQTVAAGHSVDVGSARWQELFDEFLGRVA